MPYFRRNENIPTGHILVVILVEERISNNSSLEKGVITCLIQVAIVWVMDSDSIYSSSFSVVNTSAMTSHRLSQCEYKLGMRKSMNDNKSNRSEEESTNDRLSLKTTISNLIWVNKQNFTSASLGFSR